jgi:outer membrane murein-binding lipoprotein Lpp
VTCSSDPNNFIYTNPAPTGSKTILKLTAVTSQGKNYIYAGCYREGTVIAYNCTQVQQLQATITQLQQDLESTSKETSVAKEAKRAQEDAVR